VAGKQPIKDINTKFGAQVAVLKKEYTDSKGGASPIAIADLQKALDGKEQKKNGQIL
jgi:hypothetical protein